MITLFNQYLLIGCWVVVNKNALKRYTQFSDMSRSADSREPCVKTGSLVKSRLPIKQEFQFILGDLTENGWQVGTIITVTRVC